MTALELGLTNPVGFLAVTARGTSAARVARINGNHRDSKQCGLVLQKRSKLRKRPSRMPCSVLTPNRYLFAYSGECFNRNAARSVFGELDNSFRDAVIVVAAEVGLPASQDVKQFLGSFGAFTLKRLTIAVMSAANSLHCFSRVVVAVAIGGELNNAEINPQELSYLDRWYIRKVDGGVEKELLFAVDEINLSLDAVESLALVCAINQGDDHTTAECPQADAIQTLETQNAFIVSDRSIGLESRASGFVAVEYLHGFADGSHGHLGREIEPLPKLGVTTLMDAGLGKYASRVTNLGGEARSRVKTLHRAQQNLLLFSVRQYAQLKSQFHIHIIGANSSVVKPQTKGYRLTPTTSSSVA